MDKKPDVLFVQASAIWGNIQVAVQNAVVQVFAQVGRFDWCQPYKIESQYENRGSGFLIDEQGFLITNAHVVENAKHIWVHVPSLGRQPLEAHVVGVCPERDLVLLKIDDDDVQFIREKIGGVPFLTFGDSDNVQRTDGVLALGYPLGQYHLKSTTGVISGRESIMGHSLLQITAPVNPGSSGGPLLNVRGEVIGIAIAMVPIAQNVGYVIPINELKIVLDDMYSTRIVRKPFLGARFVYASDEKARLLNNPFPSGLYIAKVFKGTLLEKAGVQEGDMLYSFNGFRLDPYGETTVPWSLDKLSLFDLITRVKNGDEVKLVIYRDGQRKDISFIIAEMQPFAIRRRFPDYEEILFDVLGGMVIMELTENHLPQLLRIAPELIRFRHLENRIDPVLIIAHILPGSYAHQLRTLRPGDIITSVNGEKVATLDDWKRAMPKSLDSGIMTLKTSFDILVAFSLEKVLRDEMRLSQAFAYPLSETAKKLSQVLKRKRGALF